MGVYACVSVGRYPMVQTLFVLKGEENFNETSSYLAGHILGEE